jgi:hypothetical protein
MFQLRDIIYKVGYIVSRLLPILICYLISSNIYHSFALTMVAEFFMSLDDVGIISYHTSKILGGTVFGIEKLLSYSAYLLLGNYLTYPVILLFGGCLYRFYPDTEKTNILYMVIVLLWTMACLNIGTPLQILGTLIYAITDYDVAMYDSKTFGIFLLPVYQIGLFLLAIG